MIKSNKIISFLLAVLCIVIFFYIWIFLCIKYGNSGYCGAKGNKHNVKWELDDDGTLIISGTGKMASYGSVKGNKSCGTFVFGNPKWNGSLKNDIKRVVIEDGITSIGKQAFYGCSFIEEVIIPDSVKDIGMAAFGKCTFLTKVNIPESVTVIPAGAFNGCTHLKEIVIPDSVEAIEWNAFNGCEKLENVTIPENLTDFGRNAFQGTAFASEENGLLIINNIVVDGTKCTGDIVIPDGVTKIGAGAFGLYLGENENLISVTLPDSVETIDEFAFSDCRNLERINIPENLKTINKCAFNNCRNLTGEIILPERVEYIGERTFNRCYNITGELILPKSVEYVGDYAFSGTDLDTITVLNPALSFSDADYGFNTSHWKVNRVTE
ncbi:MAG: leucine-rich repeat domain-containing protein [Ruminococcus sp.]|nr:leucine-rich repeat domain-containing protein [Ruminococcus sp.]